MSRSDDLRSFLALVVDVLNRADVPYMLAGSLASSIHGVPRATNDVDLVIDPTTSALDSFVILAAQAFQGPPISSPDESRLSRLRQVPSSPVPEIWLQP
jgi:hypothetical protein